MLKIYYELKHRFSSIINSSSIPAEDKARFFHFSIFSMVGVSTMIGYGLYNLTRLNYVLFYFIISSAIGLTIGWIYLLYHERSTVVYRINMVLFCALLLYMFCIGGEGGSKILWMYTFPLISFFLFGNREGFVWNILLLMVTSLFIWNPLNLINIYSYNDEIWVRFFSTYIIVSVVTYWYEYFRNSSRIEVEKKNDELKHEIIKRKEIEKQLLKTEYKLRSWLENSPVSTEIIDSDFRLEYMSAAGVKALKINDINQFYGKRFPLDNYPEPTRSRIVETLTSIHETGQASTLEAKVLDSTGEELLYASTFIPLIGEANDESTLVVSVDITEQKKGEVKQKQLEKYLQHSRRMEAIGTLAGGVAHEFNNMLAIIIGNNELLIDALPESDVARESAEEIGKASLRARDVVKQLLTFGRQDNATQEPIDLRHEVQAALKLIRSTTPSNIVINQKTPDDIYGIIGNASQINQLMINVCNNAFAAMPEEGGIVTVELLNDNGVQSHGEQRIDLDSVQHVKLKISDNGGGMAEDVLERIFEPFFTTKDVGSGSGIGMAVVHSIVEQHGGTIHADSEVGKGTTITIYFPAIGSPQEAEMYEHRSPVTGKENILFVDDEPSIVKFSKQHLENLGYRTVATTCPEKALEMITTNPRTFDLVITDMAMPKMTGKKLITEILKIRNDMPTIICTGYSSSFSEQDAAEIGARAFLMKPINKEQLVSTVREVMDDDANHNGLK